jgi:sugar (pentulose or hexulose) kinase
MLKRTQQEPKTHDFGPGCRYWGHDYTITKVLDSGQRISVSGWGHDGVLIQEGDYLLLDKGQDRSTRYQVEDIQRVMDPDDMWHATLVFAPRTSTPQKDASR